MKAMKARWLMTPVLALVASAACTGGSTDDSDREIQHARLGSLGFDVPAEWRLSGAGTELPGADVATATWMPKAADNPRKESVVVIRSARMPAVSRLGQPELFRMLAGAQKSLRGARISPVTQVTTREGLTGARVELDYVPPGLAASYHRVHVMLVDGSAVVSVLYTAAKPDPDLEVLGIVLASLRHEGTSS